MDLIDFLRQRLDEDEATARTAGGGTWCGVSMRDEGGATREQANHVLRWDPARVLAEVAAKRQVIEYAEATENVGLPAECWALGRYMVRALAQPYADHPDFAPAWLLVPA